MKWFSYNANIVTNQLFLFGWNYFNLNPQYAISPIWDLSTFTWYYNPVGQSQNSHVISRAPTIFMLRGMIPSAFRNVSKVLIDFRLLDSLAQKGRHVVSVKIIHFPFVVFEQLSSPKKLVNTIAVIKMKFRIAYFWNKQSKFHSKRTTICYVCDLSKMKIWWKKSNHINPLIKCEL